MERAVYQRSQHEVRLRRRRRTGRPAKGRGDADLVMALRGRTQRHSAHSAVVERLSPERSASVTTTRRSRWGTPTGSRWRPCKAQHQLLQANIARIDVLERRLSRLER